MRTRAGASRDIGHWGTAARVVVGVALVVGAIAGGVDALDVLGGLVAFPLVVTTVVMLRGRHARSVRSLGAGGHCLNCALIVTAFVLLPGAALLFYGTCMLVAAARGYGGCELFALSNWFLRRDDQIACPLFHVIDRSERRPITRSAAP